MSTRSVQRCILRHHLVVSVVPFPCSSQRRKLLRICNRRDYRDYTVCSLDCYKRTRHSFMFREASKCVFSSAHGIEYARTYVRVLQQQQFKKSTLSSFEKKCAILIGWKRKTRLALAKAARGSRQHVPRQMLHIFLASGGDHAV